MHNLPHHLLSYVIAGFNIVGIVLVVSGGVLSLIGLLKNHFPVKTGIVKLNAGIRIKFGSYLVLALEFFIASDIIKSIMIPSWKSLGELGAIVVIRTILSYFLTKESEKCDKKVSAN